MCGIVGSVGREVNPREVFEGLKRLEYRGYDSAGLAALVDGNIASAKSATHRESLRELTSWVSNLNGGTQWVIGHTRWATHGGCTVENAHPHFDCTGRVAVVHNGIVENFRSLRSELIELGHVFVSETDTEVVAHLIEEELKHSDPVTAIGRAFSRTRGHMSLVIGLADHPDVLYGMRRTSPLMAAMGNGRAYFASDAPAVLKLAREFYEVPEDVVVELSGTMGMAGGEELIKLDIDWASQDTELLGYSSFYEMELAQEAEAVRDTVSSLVSEDLEAVVDALRVDPYELKRLRKIVIVGCGTSYHAGLVGRFFLEHFAKVPVEVDVASEYRYRDPILDDDTLVIGVSQSGESLDTITAVREAAASGARTMSVTNVVGSQLSRLTDAVLYTRAGPEVSVASTKTHVAQMASLALFSIYLGELKGYIYPEEARDRRLELKALSAKVAETLSRADIYREQIEKYRDIDRFFFIGRNLQFPVAMEGALKLKELSYLPAEAYPAGELKHGPIAMLDESSVVVALVPRDRLYDKLVSNLQEVKARGAHLIAVAFDQDNAITDLAESVLRIPEVEPIWSPMVSVVPLQVLAGKIAASKGLDLDRPRNLAKTVTVE
jgi:glucosamine--fructose-6-phosphate aminotransferase (isomerizing)